MNYETVEGLKAIVEDGLKACQENRSKIPNDVASLNGMSSPKIRHLLNNLCSHGPCNYLEIGTWAGSTFVPALYKNDAHGIAIDNWSQFTPDECNGYNAREAFNNNLLKYGSNFKTYEVVNQNCFSLEAFECAKAKKANVFFYDGAHDEYATCQAIGVYGQLAAQPFILIVDDWELTPSVKEGTMKALLNFKVHATCEFPKDKGYHMGIFIAVVSRK